MGSVLIWWLVVFAVGLAAYPITFIALKNLPDKGYVFSKVLGLMLMGYFSWILGYFSFGGGTIFLSFLIMAVLSGALLWTWIGDPFKEFVKKNLGTFILLETFFLVAFLIAGAYKMRTPDIAGTEKPMDFAMINGILASPNMPPQDPWLSGAGISYYYFGYFIVAMLTKITSGFSIAPGEAYNLAVALTWALAAVCAFSLAFALTRRYRYSILSAASLAVLGNMDYFHRAVQSFQIGDLRVPYYNSPTTPGAVTGLAGAFQFLLSPLEHNWDYFQASRIVPVPPADKLINEFPSFSFFLSDLHPHVMAIPFVLLAMALAYNLLKSTQPGFALFSGQRSWQVAQWVLLAMVFGGLSFLNSWDFPTFLFLLGVCLLLQQWWSNQGDTKAWIKSLCLIGLPLVAASFALYLPFYMKFQSQAKGLGTVGDRTDLYYLFVMFSLFFVTGLPVLAGRVFAVVTENGSKARGRKPAGSECSICGRPDPGSKFCGTCGGDLVPVNGEVTPIPSDWVRSLYAKVGRWVFSGSDHLKNWMVFGVLLAVVLGSNAISLKLGVALFAALFMVFSKVSLAGKSDSREMVFATLLAGLAFFLILMCEFIYIKDHFSSGSLYRMNSVFKFHYQVWILLSIASGPFLKWLMENQWPRWAAWKKGLWAVTASLVLFASVMYPLLAFTARMRGSSSEGATLDGSLFYEHVFPADYQAAQWIRSNVHPTKGRLPVILEAWGGSYHQEYARVATNTGYPTVLGWDFHEAQWRGSWDQPVVRGQNEGDTVLQRQKDVDAIYTSQDLGQVRELLKKYSVDYVYVGDIERQKYKDHPGGLEKFEQLGSRAWSQGGSVLFKVNG